ncbi:TetR/AcrR family transcriptional regulator [Nocardioides sp.]|uniref:TetR/AcrR family transcriptional regulator n=1 Tax=Nocardioides sp. TaxID=35761 RepID=UPI001A20A8FE|nr:TetR/AcrR family transcriptional regulator [Nocardioides sp.]MBJ7358740.1 TetR/AcrR family transcriptional regulator [Nocardioides sp.]
MLRATLELLGEVGYAELTMSAVAERAGSTTPALYRRFPSKPELVYRAAFATPSEDQLPWAEETLWRTSPVAAVRSLVESSIAFFGRPAIRAAVAGLLAEMPGRPGLSRNLLGQLQEPSYDRLQRCLDRAAAAGTVRPGTVATDVLDLVSGTVFMALSNERDLDRAWVDRAVAMVAGGVTVTADPAGGAR